jgi:acetylornithine/LysW-gamma-L-lysine aminotransferase
MNNDSFAEKRWLVPAYVNRGLALVEGEGVYLRSPSGETYLDLMTNYGVTIFGHAHPILTERLTAQLRKLVTLHGSFANDRRAAAGRALVERCGGGLGQAFFSNSGAEAIEAALKFAVLATGKKKFIVCRKGYHGKTLGALSATDSRKFREAFEPLLWDFASVAYGDSNALRAVLDDRVAAFIVEPIQGEGGLIIPPEGYLRAAAELCRSCGALLVLDEVQTGTGRTGGFLASQPEIEAYDIVCLGKGLAGGIPFGTTLVSPQVAARIVRSSHTSTFGGNPLAAAGVLAVLELLDDGCLAHVRSVGRYFLERLRTIISPLLVDVRGRGLMLGLEVSAKRDDVLKSLQRERVLAVPAGENVVRFLPPYIIDTSHVDEALEKIRTVLSALAQD